MESNTSTLKMNGAAPAAVSGNPVMAVAVVETCQVGIPTIAAKLLACGALMSTLTAAPSVKSKATVTVVPGVPSVNPFEAATARARAVADAWSPLSR